MECEQSYDGNWYLKGYAPKQTPLSILEKIALLEQKYEMNRWQRELILAEGSKASDFAKQRAQEIEDLAEQVRK